VTTPLPGTLKGSLVAYTGQAATKRRLNPVATPESQPGHSLLGSEPRQQVIEASLLCPLGSQRRVKTHSDASTRVREAEDKPSQKARFKKKRVEPLPQERTRGDGGSFQREKGPAIVQSGSPD